MFFKLAFNEIYDNRLVRFFIAIDNLFYLDNTLGNGNGAESTAGQPHSLLMRQENKITK